MKTVKMFMLSMLFIASSFEALVASNINLVEPVAQEGLRASIMTYLDGADQLIKESPRTALIKFVVNQDAQIIVLKVETDYSDIERFVKSHLNYKKVDAKDANVMEQYTIKVTFQESNTKGENREISAFTPLYDLSLSNFKVDLQQVSPIGVML